MKILVVCQYYYPEQFRINDICESLVQSGHKVTVLTGLPNYPIGKIPQEYKWGKKRKEIIKGVNVIRTFEIGRGSSTLKLGLNYLSFMFSASFRIAMIKNDYDLLFVYQLSPITMAIPAIIAKKLNKIPLYLYSCDIWPDSMKNIISNENSFLYKSISRLSTYIYSQCDRIGITSEPFFEYFNKVHSIPLNLISYNPQHAEESYLKIPSTIENGVIDFVFLGNIGISQDIDCIISAVEEIQTNRDFLIHIVGDGSYLENCKQAIIEKELSDKFVIHGWHPLEEMPKFYELADVCLITLKGDSMVGQTVPSKLQGYMAAGRTVIGAINGAAQGIIRESKCGVCVDASDYKALALVMKDVIENQIRYSDCGQNGRKYFIENFTKEIFMGKLINQFEEVLEDN